MKKHEMVVGNEYIRIAPTSKGDFSYCRESLAFDGITPTGALMMHFPEGSTEGRILGTNPREMSAEFDDDNWRDADITKTGEKTSLHEMKGKMVHRIRPAFLPMCTDHSYCDKPVKLVCATKYHVTISDPKNGREHILDCRYANPDDWEIWGLAE